MSGFVNPRCENMDDRDWRERELEQLVRSFVLDQIDYMTKNHLGDPEKQHNIKWARKLGVRW